MFIKCSKICNICQNGNHSKGPKSVSITTIRPLTSWRQLVCLQLPSHPTLIHVNESVGPIWPYPSLVYISLSFFRTARRVWSTGPYPSSISEGKNGKKVQGTRMLYGCLYIFLIICLNIVCFSLFFYYDKRKIPKLYLLAPATQLEAGRNNYQASKLHKIERIVYYFKF